MTERYDPYDPAAPVSEEDRVYMTAMDRSRIFIAILFILVGLVITWPILPGTNWMDHQVFAPVVRWFQTHTGRAVYRYGSGIIVAVMVTWSGVRHGGKVAALRGALLMAGFFILALFLF